MEKNYYSINVPGKYGYSFAVCGNFNEDDAIIKALDERLFNDADDAEYAIVEELSQNEIEHFKKWNCLHEI